MVPGGGGAKKQQLICIKAETGRSGHDVFLTTNSKDKLWDPTEIAFLVQSDHNKGPLRFFY